MRLKPLEDRDPQGQLSAGFGQERFRTAVARACRETVTPSSAPTICGTGRRRLRGARPVRASRQPARRSDLTVRGWMVRSLCGPSEPETVGFAGKFEAPLQTETPR